MCVFARAGRVQHCRERIFIVTHDLCLITSGYEEFKKNIICWLWHCSSQNNQGSLLASVLQTQWCCPVFFICQDCILICNRVEIQQERGELPRQKIWIFEVIEGKFTITIMSHKFTRENFHFQSWVSLIIQQQIPHDAQSRPGLLIGPSSQ